MLLRPRGRGAADRRFLTAICCHLRARRRKPPAGFLFFPTEEEPMAKYLQSETRDPLASSRFYQLAVALACKRQVWS